MWSYKLVSVVVAFNGKPGKQLVYVLFSFRTHFEEDRYLVLLCEVLSILQTDSMLSTFVFLGAGQRDKNV